MTAALYQSCHSGCCHELESKQIRRVATKWESKPRFKNFDIYLILLEFNFAKLCKEFMNGAILALKLHPDKWDGTKIQHEIILDSPQNILGKNY